jgi:hypothetical protein
MFATWSITTDENLINVGHVLFLAQLASLPGQNASPEIWAGAALFASCRIIDIAANRRAILKRGKKIPRPRQLKCICAKDTAPIGSQHPVELIQPKNRNDSERKMNF